MPPIRMPEAVWRKAFLPGDFILKNPGFQGACVANEGSTALPFERTCGKRFESLQEGKPRSSYISKKESAKRHSFG